MRMLTAFDPGGTTGYAQFLVEHNSAHVCAFGEFPLWRDVDRLLTLPYSMHVVYEHIVPRSLAFDPIGLQVIGVIRYVCEQYDIPYDRQPNAVLRGVEKWGTYDLSHVRSPHAKDAIMHGIVHLRKRNIAVEW